MLRKNSHVLIIAQSARMLAQAARKSGFYPLVIDLCGDLDTRLYAEAHQKIPSLDSRHLVPALDYLTYPIHDVVYGSGFENHVASLQLLAERYSVWGNSPAVYANTQAKEVFFGLLSALAIPFPDVSFAPPAINDGWLVKPKQGQGGVGILHYQGNEAVDALHYWQRYQGGEPHSALFLADGLHSQIIGFNKQWTLANTEMGEFLFSGIINHTVLSADTKAEVTGWLTKLVPKLGLKGLNSLDFIQDGNSSYLLEINPRPPASMQLYDSELFHRHVKACQGILTDDLPVQKDISGCQVVYASHDVVIPFQFKWPKQVVDLPEAGTVINPGQPICSIIAQGKNPDEVLEQLATNQTHITQQLERLQSHAIHSQRQ